MMQSLAKIILEAYDHTRGVGHTTVAIEAAEMCKAILVVHTEYYGRELAKMGARCEIVSAWDLARYVERRPLILDNAVVIELAQEAVTAIGQLEICRRRQRLLMQRNASLEREAGRAQAQIKNFAVYPTWWKVVGGWLVWLKRQL